MRDFQRFLDPQTKYNCIHDKRKYLCVDCEGSQICEYKKRKYYCKDCEGSQICEHKKVRNNCKLCIIKKYFKEYVNTSLKYFLIYLLFQGGVCSSSNAKKFFI